MANNKYNSEYIKTILQKHFSSSEQQNKKKRKISSSDGDGDDAPK